MVMSSYEATTFCTSAQSDSNDIRTPVQRCVLQPSKPTGRELVAAYIGAPVLMCLATAAQLLVAPASRPSARHYGHPARWPACSNCSCSFLWHLPCYDAGAACSLGTMQLSLQPVWCRHRDQLHAHYRIGQQGQTASGTAGVQHSPSNSCNGIGCLLAVSPCTASS